MLNDAVSIVLYKLFLNLRETEFSSMLPLLAIVKFFVVSLGGIVVGSLMAICGKALQTRDTVGCCFLKKKNILSQSLSLSLCLLSGVCDEIHLSLSHRSNDRRWTLRTAVVRFG